MNINELPSPAFPDKIELIEYKKKTKVKANKIVGNITKSQPIIFFISKLYHIHKQKTTLRLVPKSSLLF